MIKKPRIFDPKDLNAMDETSAFEALATSRNRNRCVISDPYGNEITEYRPLHRPDPPTRRRIRTILALQANEHHHFPRCRYRDFKRASMLDSALGYPQEDIADKHRGFHSKDGHVCAECRCRHVAGTGTRGWWYWAPEDGPEHGHYGVGPCFRHSPWYNPHFIEKQRKAYKGMILREVQTMREYGRVQDRDGAYMVDVKHMGDIARARADTRTSLTALKRLADETVQKLRAHREDPTKQETMIEGLCAVFGFPVDMLSPDDRKQIIQLASGGGLTELAGGKLVPMSDKTAIVLEKDLYKAVGDSAFQSFKSHEEDFMKKETVSKMIERFYAEAETLFRPMSGEETWGRFREALRDVARELTEGESLGDAHEPRRELHINAVDPGEKQRMKPAYKPPEQRTPEEDAELFEGELLEGTDEET